MKIQINALDKNLTRVLSMIEALEKANKTSNDDELYRGLNLFVELAEDPNFPMDPIALALLPAIRRILDSTESNLERSGVLKYLTKRSQCA